LRLSARATAMPCPLQIEKIRGGSDKKQKVRGNSSHFDVGGDHSARSGDRSQAEIIGWLKRCDPNRLQALATLLDLELDLLPLV
jgi:hypothetical protein